MRPIHISQKLANFRSINAIQHTWVLDEILKLAPLHISADHATQDKEYPLFRFLLDVIITITPLKQSPRFQQVRDLELLSLGG